MTLWGESKTSKRNKKMENKLAINEGVPVRKNPFPNMTTIAEEEAAAIQKIMKTGNLSGYRGNWSDNFWGGPEIRKLEKEWSKHFKIKYSIAVNSATSGLQIACKAIGLKPNDEVIVTPWSMSCSATAPMICGATPVFADIEEDYYCLDPASVEERITKKTRAIIVVDLFGQPHDVEALRAIAKKHGLVIIEDAAQAIGSEYKKKWTGTVGDIGVFSFTQGKHITCGEGGMIVTDNPKWDLNCRLLMNHAEAVENDIRNVNMRMTEMQAAIIRVQLRWLKSIVDIHQENSKYIAEKLKNIPPIIPPLTRPGCTHSFYVQPFKWNTNLAEGIHRDRYIQAVKAELAPEKGRENEGVPISCGYIKPLYLFPIFQNSSGVEAEKYKEGTCPVAERLWKDELFLHRLLGMNIKKRHLDNITEAFFKVWRYRDELRK
jgi:dTDP-4-amino-4,6-dideoxygalactose transaminase